MKTDRFSKVLLVIIAVLLTMNYFKVNGTEAVSIPFLETKIEAVVPVFIKAGKTYQCSVGDRPLQNYEIKQIDKENGWVEARWSFSESSVEGVLWLNLSHFESCSEVKTTSNK